MNIIDITSLPAIRHAHTFEANPYHTYLLAAPNCIEVTHILEGTLFFSIGEIEYCAEQGDILCLLHNQPITLSTLDYHKHHTISATVEWHFCNDSFGGLFLPTITKAVNVNKETYRLIDEMIGNQVLYRTVSARGATIFLQILQQIDSCNHNPKLQMLSSEQRYVQRAKQYIDEHLALPITQNEVAHYLDISPGYLCSVFKRIEGVPLMRYINHTKLGCIKSLMERENLRLYEAAAMYGYSDPNYVSRLYKRLYGYKITQTLHAFEEPK